MPILKVISGHTNCKDIKRYLEKHNRALARDFYNLSWDERDMEGYGEEDKVDVSWADEMDELRVLFENDKPYEGRKARTYIHYMLSPDPEDGIDLDALRGIAGDWAMRYFADYQVAIIYHDDNTNGIPHAHIVVNNTNLKTGNRVHVDNPLELNRVLQDMARTRGLRGLSNISLGKPKGAEGNKQSARDGADTSKTQEIHVSRAEHEIQSKGGYSWVADIRSRVSVARSLAKTEAEFKQVLDMLDVEVLESTAKTKQPDWLYAIKGNLANKISGGKLGYAFSKQSIERQFAEGGKLASMNPREVLKAARSAVTLGSLQELDSLANALEVCAKYGIASALDATVRIRAMEAKAERSFSNARTLAAIADIQEAKGTLESYGLLPQKTPVRQSAPQSSKPQQQPERGRQQQTYQDQQRQQQRVQQQRLRQNNKER
jgi:hypothetical protein